MPICVKDDCEKLVPVKARPRKKETGLCAAHHRLYLSRKWKDENKEHRAKYWHDWYAKNTKELNARKRSKQTSPAYVERCRQYRQRPDVKERNSKRQNEKRLKDPEYRERMNAKARARRRKNPEHIKSLRKKYYDADPKKANARAKKWRNNNAEYVSSYNKKYKEANIEWYRNGQKKWAAENKDKNYATSAKRRAQKLSATASWYDHNAVVEIYRRAVEQSERTGKIYNVDHIVPLQGKSVCGLHVQTNLRIVLARTNNKKGNRFDKRMEQHVLRLMARDQAGWTRRKVPVNL